MKHKIFKIIILIIYPTLTSFGNSKSYSEDFNQCFIKKITEENLLDQKVFSLLKKECEKLMNRVNFENQQLDKLEMETINLEEKIIKTLSSHAKKQKK